MARYTKIPETNVAGSMGNMIGKAAGGISSAASATLGKMERDLIVISNNLDKETPSSLQQKVSPKETQLNSIERSISSVESSIRTVKTLASTIKAPVSGLKSAIRVIKMVPMTQMWLPVCVTTVYSDLLEMLAETAAQLEELSDSLSSIASTSKGTLEPLEQQIQQLRELIETLKVKTSLSDSEKISADDKQKLTNLGLFDKAGNGLLDSLAMGLARSIAGNGSKNGKISDLNSVGSGNLSNLDLTSTAGSKNVSVGNSGEINLGYGIQIDLSNTELQNKVALGVPGDVVEISDGFGDYLHEVFCESENQPSTPLERVLVPSGWSASVPKKEPCWVTKTTVSGKTQRPGTWSVPEKITLPYLGLDKTLRQNQSSGINGMSNSSNVGNGGGTGESILYTSPYDTLRSKSREKDLQRGGISGTVESVQRSLGKSDESEFTTSKVISSSVQGRAQTTTDSLLKSQDGSTQYIKVLGISDILNLSTDTENKLEGILKIEGTADLNSLIQGLVEKIDRSAISLDLKDVIRNSLSVFSGGLGQKEQKSSKDLGKPHYYTSSDGTVYEMRVVIDPNSPSIAPRRYVEVLDPSGVPVLDGTKSFSSSEEILIEEMKVRLGQLLG